MRNILKRALSLTLALVMVFGLLGLGAAPKVSADSPIQMELEFEGVDGSNNYSYKLTYNGTATAITVNSSDLTQPSPVQFALHGAPLSSAVIVIDGVTFTIPGSDILPIAGFTLYAETDIENTNLTPMNVRKGSSAEKTLTIADYVSGYQLVAETSNSSICTVSEFSGKTFSVTGVAAGSATVTVKMVKSDDSTVVFDSESFGVTVYEPSVSNYGIDLASHNGDVFNSSNLQACSNAVANVSVTGTYLDKAGLSLTASGLTVSGPTWNSGKTQGSWTVSVPDGASYDGESFTVTLKQGDTTLESKTFAIDNQAPTGTFLVVYDGATAQINVAGITGATNVKVNGGEPKPVSEFPLYNVPVTVGEPLSLQAFDINSNMLSASPVMYEVELGDADLTGSTAKTTTNGVYYNSTNKAEMALPLTVSNGTDPVTTVYPWIIGLSVAADHKSVNWGSATEGEIAVWGSFTAYYESNAATVYAPVTNALTKSYVLDTALPTVTASAYKGVFYFAGSDYYLGVPSPNKVGHDVITFTTADNDALATDLASDTLDVNVSVTDSAVNRQWIDPADYKVEDNAGNESAGLILADSGFADPVSSVITATPIVPAWVSNLTPAASDDWYNSDISVAFTLNPAMDYTLSDTGEEIDISNVSISATFNGNPVTLNGSGYGGYTATLSVAGVENDAAALQITVTTTYNRVKQPMVTQASVTYHVDGSAPTVTASIDGTAANAKYFNASRTLTVEVADASAFTGVLSYTKDGTALTENFDASPFTFEFTDEAAYTITDIVVTDAHDNTTTLTAADITGEAVGEFIIDKIAPVLTLAMSDNDKVENGKYFPIDERTMTLTVTEPNLDDAVGGTVTFYDDSTEDFGKNGLDGYTFSGDGVYGVKSIVVTDLAGNETTVTFTANNAAPTVTPDSSFTLADGTVAPYEFVLDTTAPEITVEFDNNNARKYDGDDTYYFKAARVATVKIKEENFDENKVTITTTGTVADTWTLDNDWHVKTVTFDSDGAHTFAVECTDLAEQSNGGVTYPSGTVSPAAFTIDTVLPTVTATSANGVFYSVGTKYYLGVPAPETADNVSAIGNGSDSISFVTADVGTGIQTDLADNPLAVTITNKVSDPANLDPAVIKVTDKAGNDSNTLNLTYEGGTYTATSPVKVAPLVPAYPSDFNPDPDVVYATDIAATFTVNKGEDYTEDSPTEIPLTAVTVSARFNGQTVAVSGTYGGEYTATLPINTLEAGEYEFIVTVETQARGKHMVTTGKAVYKVDATAPEVAASIDLTPSNDKYFSGNTPRTLTVTATDASAFTGVLSYTKDGTALTENFDASPFTFEFTDEAAYTITDIVVTDAHGNWSKLDAELADPTDTRYATFSISGQAPKDFVYDNTRPTIAVAYDNNTCNTYTVAGEDVFYYKEDRTATITITDVNFDPALVTLTTTGVVTDQKDIHTMDAWTQNGNEYTATVEFTTDAEHTFDVSCKDLAFNENDGISFDANTKGDKAFILDKTNPELYVSLEATDVDIEEISTTNTLIEEGKYFLKFTPVVETDQNNEDVTLTLTIRAEDLNLATDSDRLVVLDKFSLYSVDADNQKFIVSDLIPAVAPAAVAGTISYSASVTVKVNEAYFVDYSIHVEDLAGNLATADDVHTSASNASNAALTCNFLPSVTAGTVSNTFVFDRRQSSSEDDFTAPVINLAPDAGTPSVNGIFTADVPYTISVSDGAKMSDYYVDPAAINPAETDVINYMNTGLKEVRWEITSGNATINGATTGTINIDDTTDIAAATLLVEPDNEEARDIVLRVTATDKAGNIIIKSDTLSIDTIAPRVTIEYSNNNSVRNNEYYNADRTLTVTVDDLFFESGTLTVNGENTALHNGVNTYAFTGPDTDYVVSMTAKDLVNHVTNGSEAGTTEEFTVAGGTTNPWKFTVDKVVPTIAVTFDNNQVENDHYYKDARTATAMITERNFDAADAIYTATVGASTLNGWSAANPHVATAVFNEDGDYAFTLSFQDRAGNQATAYTNPLFTIDLQDPEIEITGVEDYSANRGDLSPIVTFTDNNFKRDNDVATYSVNIEKVKGLDLNDTENVPLTFTPEPTEDGVRLTYENLSKIRDNDGIYTLTATITDLSGRTVEKVVHYSLNRTGSTYYAVGDETINLLDKVYSNKAPTVVISEINPDKIVSYNVTVSLNNSVAKLTEGSDFTVAQSGDTGRWKENVYTINSSVFQSEGKLIEGAYTIIFDSEDEAGNLNSNRDNEVNVPVAFVLDETPPVLQINGIDEPRIQAESVDATVIFQDGTVISRIEIYLNGELVRTIEGEELATLTDSFVETIQSSNAWRVLTIKAIDAAGNESEVESIRFLVTTNALRLFFANPLLVGGAAVLIAGGTTLGVVLSKKKKKSGEAK